MRTPVLAAIGWLTALSSWGAEALIQRDIDNGYFHIGQNWDLGSAPGVAAQIMEIDSHTIVIGYSDQVDPPDGKKEKDKRRGGPLFDVAGQTIRVLPGGRLHLSFYNDGNGGHADHFHDMLLGCTVELRGGIIGSQFGPEVRPPFATWIDSHTHGTIVVYNDSTWYDEANDREIEFDELRWAQSATLTFYGIKNSPSDSSDLWFDQIVIPTGVTARMNLWGATHGIAGKVSSNPAAFKTGNLQLPAGARLEINSKDSESFEIRSTQPAASIAGTIAIDASGTISESDDEGRFSLMVPVTGRWAPGAIVDLQGNQFAQAEVFHSGGSATSQTNFLKDCKVVLRDFGQIRLSSGENADQLIGGTIDLRGDGTISMVGNKSKRRSFDRLVVDDQPGHTLVLTETGSQNPVYVFREVTLEDSATISLQNACDVAFSGAVTGSGTLSLTGNSSSSFTFEASCTFGGLRHPNAPTGVVVVNAGVTLTVHQLEIGANTIAPGTYSASSLSGFSGSGTVVVTPPPPSAYQIWKDGFGVGAASDDSDGDHDGIDLLIEYGLDLDPTTADTDGMPALDRELGLTFKRARADLDYEIWDSENLKNWSLVSRNPGAVGENVVVEWSPSPAEKRGFRQLRVKRR